MENKDFTKSILIQLHCALHCEEVSLLLLHNIPESKLITTPIIRRQAYGMAWHLAYAQKKTKHVH